MIHLAPFPRPLRYLIAASFFFVYQYAVIARSYELLPLLAFGSACLFRQGLRRVIPFAALLSLMTHVCVHGAVIALALATAFALRLRPQWPGLQAGEKQRTMVAVGMFGFALLMLAIILYPPPTLTVAMADAGSFTLEQHLAKALQGLCGAVLDSQPLALTVLLLAAIWFFERRALPLMLIAVGGTAFIFGFLRGVRHHEGLILIALLTAIWAAWPTQDELARLSKASVHLHTAMTVTLALVFAWQTYWSVVAIGNDWRGPYSGARDAAAFLQSIHAETAGCYGYNYWTVGVQPYFEHNIFANLGGPDAPACFHQTKDFHNLVGGWNAFRNRTSNPPCLLLSFGVDWRIDVTPTVRYVEMQGYDLAHVSDGSAFFKDELGERQLYLYFVRRPGVPEQFAQNSAGR